MEPTPAREQEKLTITELQRYLPLKPPASGPDLPENIKRYLGSSSFNNFSLKEQSKIKESLKVAYRNYYPLQVIVEHLSGLTSDRFTRESIEQALCNSAFKYELIDWFLFVRIVSSGERQRARPERNEAAAMIQRQYKIFAAKKKVLNGRQEVETLKRSLEERLVRQFGKEVLNEIKELVDRNRVQMEERYHSQQFSSKTTYVQLQKLVNNILQCALDTKKVKYLYLRYDYANVGWFQLSKFTSEIFTEIKVVSVPKQLEYLQGVQSMMEFVRKYTKQIYYSSQELVNAYLQDYHGKTIPGEADELHPYQLYLFLTHKCENKLSYLQATAIHAAIRFVSQLTVLYERKPGLDLSGLIEKMLIKKERKRQLKKENEVFYSFRRIILILLSKSKSSKLTRQEFAALITSYDPTLKYDAFYCVWRVYGGLINLDRMRKECPLNPLACFFKATVSDQEYDRIVERLTDEFPEGAQVSYSKVEERINLQCQFVLETQQIKPLPLGDFEPVIYRKCIAQILPLDFELIIRAYIFRKVSEKFIAIWRGIKLKKQERQNRELLESIFMQTAERDKKEKEQPKQKQKDKGSNRRLTNNRSVASLASKTSAKSKKQINFEHLEIVKGILYEIFDEVKIPQNKGETLGELECIKLEIALASKEHYTFRSILTKACFHPLIGGVVRGKDFLQLREGVQSHLDVKIPFKPGVQVLDFAIWNNSLAVFTSYNTLELYSLAQTSNYPFRSIQFPMAPSPIENTLFDRVCSNRFHGRYPAVVKASGSLLLVSLVHSKEVCFVDEDPLVPVRKLALSFGDHFYPKELLKWLGILKKEKSAASQANKLIEGLVTVVQKFKEGGFCSAAQQQLAALISTCGLGDNIWAFELRQVFTFCCEYSSQILRAMLYRQCGRLQNLLLPYQLAGIVKLVLQYMRESNYSLHEMIQEITYQGEEVGLREFKNYLMRVAYEQFLQFEKEIDKYLRTLTRSKTIDYAMLAHLLGQDWGHSLMEKPYFIVNDLALLAEYSLLFYTLNGSPSIYVRNIETGELMARFTAHRNTPVFHLIPSALLLISADTVKMQGETVDLLVWRLQEDLIDKFSIRPPWIISPFYRLRQAHDQPVTSITYLPRSHIIVSSSLDSTMKLWAIHIPFALSQLRRVYSGQHLYLSAQGITVSLQEGIFMEFLLTCKISKQISPNNAYKHESTVELFIVEPVKAKAASYCAYLETPLRVQQAMIKQGEALAVRKKVLMAKISHQQIESLNRATLMLQSLDRNIYNSLKNAYIFGNFRQLTLLTQFLRRSPHAELVVRKVCEDYGLNLISGVLAADRLEMPPNLSEINNSAAMRQLQFSNDVFQEIFDKIMKNSSNNQTLIQGESLKRLISPYIVGEDQQKLASILQQSLHDKNRKLIVISRFKQFIKTYTIEGHIPKFLSSMRSLLQFLKERRIKLWELFSVSKLQLQRCKKVRKADFAAFLQQSGFSNIKIDTITNFLSKNGVISLFQFLHYVRIALEESKHSSLMPNYSSLLMTQSQLQLSQMVVEKDRQDSHDIHQTPISKSGLHQEIEMMMNRKSSRLSAISQSSERERSRGNSAERIRASGDDDGRGMLNSTSRGSLSKDITYTKDTIKREAINIMRNLQQLMRNQAKSMWELLALATPDFISSPIVSETQYFVVFDYLKTPFLLKEKLKLLKYMRREGNGVIDLNVLFELTEAGTVRGKFQGEKYLISYILEKLEEMSPSLEQAIEIAFFLSRGEKELGVDVLTLTLSQPPFNCSHFALREFQQLLLQQKKLLFSIVDLSGLFSTIIEKHQLKINFNKLNFMGELRFRVQKKGESLKQIFPKGNIDLPYFIQHAGKLHPEPAHLQRDFHNIITAANKHRTVKWQDFIKELERRLGKFNEETNRQLQAGRKFVKQLEAQRMTILQFFLGLDRSRKFYVTQQQLQAGLAEFNIQYDLWANIQRRNPKKLTYFQLVRFLQDCRILNYKTVDSEVEVAMEKFTRRYLRNQDVETAYNRIKGDPQKPQLMFEEFRSALKAVSYFSQEEIILLFGMLAREGVAKESREGNDELLRDPANLKLGVGFKRFSDVIGLYRADNITKTVAFRFYDYLKKRNISLLFEYRKWMERNKKNKEVAEALKNDTAKITKDTFLLFIAEIKGGLNEKEQKELLAKQPSEIHFQAFLSDLETTYKKGTLDIQKEQSQHYLRQLLRKVGEIDVSLDRLFQDFSQRGALSLSQLNDLCAYVQLGLNKIQLKKLFAYLDAGKQGSIGLMELLEAAQRTRQEMERDSQDYRFDFIIEKLTLNQQKFVLKPSKVSFSLDRARIIFSSLLSTDQTDALYRQCLRELRREAVSQQEMEEFIKRKSFELKMRFDKKDRELIAKILSFLKRVGIEIEEAFSYLSRHSPRQELRKQDFVLLMQTLELRCDLAAINSLFSHLEEGRRGVVSRGRWEEKLQLVQLQQEIQTGVQSEDLRLFYKVKLFLAEVYLIFVRKSYKQNQIYHFFDRHSNGRLAPDELLRSLAQLGATPEDDFGRKIINYLDRNRENSIQVSFVVQELEQCLSSKMRLVLHTKTSRLFQEKAKLFQEKAAFFIKELSEREELVEVDGAVKSCLLQYKFIDLMRDFGCPLTTDEAKDVRLNFHACQGYLFLYPIYMAFANLFREAGSETVGAGQSQRLRKLFLGMISHNYSLEELQRFNSHQQLYNFIEQVASFTPVDIRLIIDSCSLEGSNSIDVQLLKQKIRNVYLSQENEAISESFVAFAGNSHQDVLNELRQKIDLKLFRQVAGSSKGLMDLQTFEGVLQRMGVGLTKGVAKKYFDMFSEGKDKLDVGKLLEEGIGEAEDVKKSMMFKSFITVKSEQSNPLDKFQELSSPDVMISEHIAKSLIFKETSLNRELAQDYMQNFGYISHANFLIFLQRTGIDTEKCKEQIDYFLQKYSLIFNHNTFSKDHLIRVQQLQSMITNFSHEFVALTDTDQLEEKQIESEDINQWIAETAITQEELYAWAKEQECGVYAPQQIFKFLCKKQGGRSIVLEQFVRTIPSFIDSFDLFLTWYHGRQDTIKASKQPKDQQQTDAQDKKENKDYLEMFISKNPIRHYEQAISRFCSIKLQPNPRMTNLERLSAILLYEHILTHQYVLQIKPNLLSPTPDTTQPQLKITPSDLSLPIKTLGNLTIDQERDIDPCGLLLINQKYYGFGINQRLEFENMAIVACTLDPSAVFLKTKNFYLWEPNAEPMPKGGLHYRWSYIPSFAIWLLTQMSKVHEAGFCLPHLRWKDLNRNRGIEKVLYPCAIDRKGILRERLGWKSLDFEDPYCCPDFYRMDEGLTFRCDSWIFGCLLYEFIYSHPPVSFLSQLQLYANECKQKFSIADLLQMEELPSGFTYTFYDELSIQHNIALQHQLKPNIAIESLKQAVKREQSLRGLLKHLQISFGEDFRFYKEEFELMEQLNTVIYECLNPNPYERPTIQSLLTRKVFNETTNMDLYKSLLLHHIDASQFYANIIEPVTSLLTNSTIKTNYSGKIQASLAQLSKAIDSLLNLREIQNQFIIPKSYPWPSSARGPYTSAILNNKQSIRRTNNFNIMTLLFSSGYFQGVIFLLFLNKETPSTHSALEILLDILARLLITFKQYNYASCGFVEVLMDALLKILYQEPLTMIGRNWLDDVEIPDDERDILMKMKRRHEAATYLRPHHFSSKHCQRALRMLEQLCYLTGQGNIEYLPIRHYLIQNEHVQSLLEMVHCHVKLVSGREDVMMINYFRDRLEDQFRFSLSLRLKTEVDLLRFLTCRNEAKTNTLTFLRDALSLYPSRIALFKQSFLYSHLAALLRDPLESVPNKCIIMELACLVMNDQRLRSKLCEVSSNLMAEVVRLMIEPAKTHASHEEYVALKPSLWMIAKAIEESVQILEGIQGGQAVLEAFLQKEEEGLSLGSQSHIKHD